MKYKKINQFVKQNGIVLIFLFVMVGVGCFYISQSARDIVFMDFWRNITNLIPAIKEGQPIVVVAWKDYLGQRNFLQQFLLAINIQFFSLNCLWESYGGIFAISASGLLLYRIWLQETRQYLNKAVFLTKQLLYLPILLALFSLNQWEILSLQFSLAFMVRIFFFLLIFCLISRELTNKNWNPKVFLGIGCLTGFVILTMSQLYFPGMLLIIGFGFGFAFFLNEGQSIQKAKAYFYFCLPVIGSVVIYFIGISPSSTGGNGQLLWNSLLNGDFFKGILYMLASSILPQTICEKLGEMGLLLVGGLLLLVILLAVFLYFYCKMYTTTYLPLFTCGYGLISIPIIMFGRLGTGDLFYLTSSRYTCETTLIWVGCGFVFAHFVLQYSKTGMKAIAVGCLVAVSVAILYTDYTELTVAPYRGSYKDSLLEILQQDTLETAPSEDLARFQAPVEVVQQGVELMKKYKLNVFSDSH